MEQLIMASHTIMFICCLAIINLALILMIVYGVKRLLIKELFWIYDHAQLWFVMQYLKKHGYKNTIKAVKEQSWHIKPKGNS